MILQALTTAGVKQIFRKVFPQRTIKSVEVLAGGLINTNLKVAFDSEYEPVVLRVYRDGAKKCRKELAINALLKGKVPIADILSAEPSDETISFSVLEYVNGLTFQQLKRTGNIDAIHEASSSVGTVLATIGQFKFPKPGELEVEDSIGLKVGAFLATGQDGIPRLLDKFLASPPCAIRLGALAEHVRAFVWSRRMIIPYLDDQSTLVHNDFGNQNILVRERDGKWEVAAILDWELAFSGSPLLDVGHFLRYERTDSPIREPFFSQAYVEHGGHLIENWREIVRIIDLTGLIECLTHDNLPRDVELELVELIKATLENRDPNFP